MQYALNSACFPYDDVAKNCELAAAAGYDGIEPMLDPAQVTDDAYVSNLVAATDEYDLAVPSIVPRGLGGTPSSPVPETRAAGLDAGRDGLKLADELGCERILVVAGAVNEETSYDVAYENAVDGVSTLAADAADYGITLGIENVWTDFLLSPLEFAEFVDTCAEHGPVGAYFDVGNILKLGRPEQWIRILGDRLSAIHVKDFETDIGNGNGFTYPLQGDVPWEMVADALADVEYDGWIAPEVPPYPTNGHRMPAQVLDNLRSVFE